MAVGVSIVVRDAAACRAFGGGVAGGEALEESWAPLLLFPSNLASLWRFLQPGVGKVPRKRFHAYVSFACGLNRMGLTGWTDTREQPPGVCGIDATTRPYPRNLPATAAQTHNTSSGWSKRGQADRQTFRRGTRQCCTHTNTPCPPERLVVALLHLLRRVRLDSSGRPPSALRKITIVAAAAITTTVFPPLV